MLGFDLRYLYERAVFLKCLDDFHYLGRLQNEKSKLEEKKLSSSALGDNFMKLLPMKGRVHIDLMKDVQKTYKLSSYRLDSVASSFIQGKITELSTALESDDSASIEASLQNLNSSIQQVGQEIYSNPENSSEESPQEESPDASPDSEDDNTVEGEYRQV